ncbi:MAG: AraC family transcriptional regulator [Oscillospiraceae bacterium]
MPFKYPKPSTIYRLPICPLTLLRKTLGFPDPLYFSRIFKKHTGLSPRNYRQQKHD